MLNHPNYSFFYIHSRDLGNKEADTSGTVQKYFRYLSAKPYIVKKSLVTPSRTHFAVRWANHVIFASEDSSALEVRRIFERKPLLSSRESKIKGGRNTKLPIKIFMACLAKMGPFCWATVPIVKMAFHPF